MSVKRRVRSAPEVIARIKSGKVDPTALAPKSRQQCVVYLMSEGLMVSEIAQVLNCSERTIGRDRKLIQEEAAIEHDPKLGGIFAGRLLAEAENSKSRIRRATRAADIPPGDKVAAEKACFEIEERMTKRMQSLGYLPQATQRIEAEVRGGLSLSLDEILQESERLKKIEQQSRGKKPKKKVTNRSLKPGKEAS